MNWGVETQRDMEEEQVQGPMRMLTGQVPGHVGNTKWAWSGVASSCKEVGHRSWTGKTNRFQVSGADVVSDALAREGVVNVLVREDGHPCGNQGMET